MVSAADAAAIPISSMSRGRRAVVYRSGWRWRGGSSRPLALDRRWGGSNGSGFGLRESVLFRGSLLRSAVSCIFAAALACIGSGADVGFS